MKLRPLLNQPRTELELASKIEVFTSPREHRRRQTTIVTDIEVMKSMLPELFCNFDSQIVDMIHSMTLLEET